MKKSQNMKMIATKRVLLKSGTRDFQNGPPFERSPCVHVAITGNF